MNEVIIAEKKPWWESRTLWFNTVFAGLAALEASFSMIQPYVPGNVYAWGMMSLTVGNTMLRIVTKQGLTK